MQTAITLMERGLIPDRLIRMGIRRLLRQRLREQASQDNNEPKLLAEFRASPIALHTDAANEQHYELPPTYFQHIMGQHLKYSACYWPDDVNTLDDAEAAMLELTCERAEISDGQTILELGCGWGALSLWLAQHYPAAQITAVSNSTPQREFIEAQCAERKLDNLSVITANMNNFDTSQRFDRVVSIEMFEHMRNYQALLARIAVWLRPQGKLFVHIFSHRRYTYPFETASADDWMGRYFFTGGLMPSRRLLPTFDDDFELEQQWQVNGQHYQRTCVAWLANQDRNREAIMALFRDTYGEADAVRWFRRWRVFFMACSELFGFRDGEEWDVSHYRFSRLD